MIPVLINNRDILSSVQEQIHFFQRCPEARIILIDNASTYHPLRQWYNSICLSSRAFCHTYTSIVKEHWEFIDPNIRHVLVLPHDLFLFQENLGPRGGTVVVPHLEGEFDYYFLSDADMDYSDIDPLTFLSDLQAGLERYPLIEGASASIRLDDIPETNMTRLIREYEGQNWDIKLDDEWWRGACDTAGVLRRVVPGWSGGYTGIRSVKHIARHRPWYFIPESQELPRCKICGYTSEDQEMWWDHNLCKGTIPPGWRTPPDFQHFYAHANPSGTAYTSFILDRGRNP